MRFCCADIIVETGFTDDVIIATDSAGVESGGTYSGDVEVVRDNVIFVASSASVTCCYNAANVGSHVAVASSLSGDRIVADCFSSVEIPFGDFVCNSANSSCSVEIPAASFVRECDKSSATFVGVLFQKPVYDVLTSTDSGDDDEHDPTYSPSQDSDSEADKRTDQDDDELLDSENMNATTEINVGQEESENNPVDIAATSVNSNSLAESADHMASTEMASDGKVEVAVTNNWNCRKYDKVAFCYYCSKPQAKLMRHLRLKHSQEPMVDELISEKDEARRKILGMKLRNLGNHNNNVKVRNEEHGLFVVAHRPTKIVSYTEYVPCKYCYGYFAKKSIWKHKCLLAPTTESGAKAARVRKGAKTLLSDQEPEGSATIGFTGLLNGMRNDEIGTLACKDHLILKLGRSLCDKFGGDRSQFNYIRSKMRQVARLLLELRKNSEQHQLSVSDAIHPSRFSAVAAATKNVAGFHGDSSEYHAPSSALRSGTVIKRLAEIKQAEALERCDQAVAESCVQFLKLCELKWPNEVSAVALRNITDRKRSGVSFVPLTEDVVKLNTFLNDQAKSFSPSVSSDISAFLAMTQVVLAKVILFNRKRQGEVSKVTVDDYHKKGKAQNSVADMSLSDFERSLLKVFDRVEIRGKRGRTVPLLLTGEVTSWIDTLLAARSTFIHANNPFLFATYGEHSHFRGSDVLRKFSADCGAAKPELLTSTRLRKQIASLAQVVSLKENELDSLATFMGHDLRVHTQFYRMPLDVMEIGRISKLFLAAERGTITQFAGKQLSEITIDAEVEDIEAVSDNDSLISDVEPLEMEVGSKEVKNKTRVLTKRQKWTETERDAVRCHFAEAIMSKRLPGKSEIEAFLSQSGIDRQWRNVKDHIRNFYLS